MAKMPRFLMIIGIIISITIVSRTEALSLDVSELLHKGDDIPCALNQDCDHTKLSESSYDNYYKTDKSSWDSLGLDPNLLHINQISVGFVPAFREKKNPNSPEQINSKLFKPMAIMGDYISLSSWDPELKAIDWAYKIAAKMKEVNNLGITVWLRFGHEMNGEWYNWGMQPEKFKNKWQLLAREIKRVTNKTYMVWSPNAMFGNGIDEKRGGYTPYFPDPQTVDMVGLSFYHWGKGAIRTNVKPTQAEAITKLYEFSKVIHFVFVFLLRGEPETNVGTSSLIKIYGRGGWNKPVIVAETAACYTTYQGTTQSVGGGYSELDIKMTWLHLLVDRYIKQLIPDLKAVIWFEIDKDEVAPGTNDHRNEDFRLVVGNPEVSYAVRQLFESYHSTELAERS
ncbi:hypothetical protein VP01_748g8 [Puccinia sorghi]|uniref:GH26 domain-containing protein n=1 Tax=Puccinia sorghi TaxID=27349 RepID=A0A0L6UD71_9BASI|nr:hypothetical protein VP01_748g8 [Puccinia sorghi]